MMNTSDDKRGLALMKMLCACRMHITERLGDIIAIQGLLEAYGVLNHCLVSKDDPNVVARAYGRAQARIKLYFLWHTWLECFEVLDRGKEPSPELDELMRNADALPDGDSVFIADCLTPTFTKDDPAWWLPEYQRWVALTNAHNN